MSNYMYFYSLIDLSIYDLAQPEATNLSISALLFRKRKQSATFGGFLFCV